MSRLTWTYSPPALGFWILGIQAPSQGFFICSLLVYVCLCVRVCAHAHSCAGDQIPNPCTCWIRTLLWNSISLNFKTILKTVYSPIEDKGIFFMSSFYNRKNSKLHSFLQKVKTESQFESEKVFLFQSVLRWILNYVMWRRMSSF